MTKQELYWADREQKNMLQNVLDQKALDDAIREVNKKASADTEKILYEWYGKYAGQNGMTYEEARKTASEADIKALAERAKQYVADKDLSPQANAEMKLYNLSMKSSRMELLQDSFKQRANEYSNELEQAMFKGLSGTARDALREQAGIFGEFMHSDAEMKKLGDFVAKTSYKGNTFSERIWGYNQNMKKDLDEAVRKGLMLGENIGAQARKVASAYGRAEWESLRLLRTESARVRTQARHESFERLGYTHFKWVPRGNPCEVCLEMVGETEKKPLEMKTGQMPPMHPNCWCSTAPVMPDNMIDPVQTDREFEKKWEQAANGDLEQRKYFEGLYQNSAKWEWNDLLRKQNKLDLLEDPSVKIKRMDDELKDRQKKMVDLSEEVRKTNTDLHRYKMSKYDDLLWEKLDEKGALADKARFEKRIEELTAKKKAYDDIEWRYRHGSNYSKPDYNEWVKWQNSIDIGELRSQNLLDLREIGELKLELVRRDEYIEWRKWRNTTSLAELNDKAQDLAVKIGMESNEILDLTEKIKKEKVQIYFDKDLKPKLLEELAGVKPGEAMPFEKADNGNANPLFRADKGYRINCQSCVVSHEARLRGYDVSTLPNTKGSTLEVLSRRTSKAWIDPDGNNPEYIFDENNTTPKRTVAWLEETVKADERYSFEFVWKTGHSGHIVTVARDEAGQLRMYDPQVNERFNAEGILEYLKDTKHPRKGGANMYYAGPKLTRVDNCQFDKSIVDKIMK